MTDDFVPEADAIEQEQEVTPGDERPDPELSPADEVPEADAIEQSQTVGDADDDEEYDLG